MASIWCYTCSSRFSIRVWAQDPILCPDCGGGFVEQIEDPSTSPPFPSSENTHNLNNVSRPRRNAGGDRDRSPFNPVIVLRGHQYDDSETGSYELYYDDNSTGLQPLPSSMSEFLMSSGFDRILDQLSEMNGRFHNPPAAKSAIESMPKINIDDEHVELESHCAVCKEKFELDMEAREMPCKHIYHADCILPWLSVRNSCPVCRHELPAGEVPEGLTIWRLPGGGFAVGRFSGGRLGELELPVVYTEMDGGGFNTASTRRVSWALRGSRPREEGGIGVGIGRVVHNFFSFFGRMRNSSSRRSTSRRRRREWALAM